MPPPKERSMFRPADRWLGLSRIHPAALLRNVCCKLLCNVPAFSRKENIPLDAWHVPLSHIGRSVDRSALYFCGFPTLHHIKHKVSDADLFHHPMAIFNSSSASKALQHMALFVFMVFFFYGHIGTVYGPYTLFAIELKLQE